MFSLKFPLQIYPKTLLDLGNSSKNSFFMAYFTEELFENQRWKDLNSSAFKNSDYKSPVKGAAYF